MRRVLAVVSASAFVMALAATLFAESKTVKGEVVDVQCQAKKAENKGEDHENCALSCAKRGAKMGILTDDGVYVIAGDYAANKNEKLIPFVAKAVTATGDVTEADGQKTINVASMEVDKK